MSAESSSRQQNGNCLAVEEPAKVTSAAFAFRVGVMAVATYQVVNIVFKG